MLTELQRRKITRLFQIYDANLDGYLEGGDFERVAAGIADFLEIPPGSTERQQHTIEYMAGWEQIKQAADSDNDNRVTLDEFIASTAGYLQHPEIFKAVTLGSTQSTLNWMDKDRDGRIGRAEYLGVVQAYNMTRDEAEEAFGHLDREGDGYIDKDELLRDTEEFFMSDDPNAPGNWLMGRF